VTTAPPTDDPPPAARIEPRVIYRWAVMAALGVFTVALVVAALYTVRQVLVQILIAVFIAVSLDPLVRWMIRHRIKRGQAVALIFLVVLVLTAILLWSFIPSLVREANGLTTDFPGYLDKIRERSPSLHNLETRFNLESRIDAAARDLPGKIAGQALSFGQRFLGAMLSVLLVIVMTIYLMLDLSRLRRGLVRLFPRHHRNQVSDIITLVIDKVGLYMIGNLLISLIAGVSALIVMEILRTPFALPLAVLIAITDLIPLIGATIGAAICVVVAAATSEIWPDAAILVIFFIVYQQLENYLIAPRVLRGTVDISAAAVLFAALVGGSVLGVVGAIMAVPIAAVIKVVLSERIRQRDEEAAQEAGELPPDGDRGGGTAQQIADGRAKHATIQG
jgi:predicted PurR-regulated permease PerM